MDQLPFQLPPDWQGALTLLGTMTFGAWFVSEFVEKEQWFQTLASAWKSRAVFIILLALSVLSKVSFLVASHQPVTMQDIYVALGVAFVGYLSSNWYHNRNHDVTTYTSKERAATAALQKSAGADNPPLSGAPAPAA